MSKAKVVKARKGDTLCEIAIKHGFADCKPLRDEAKNKDFLKRPLRKGDKVTVPAIKKKKEDKADKKKHKWKRPGIPPPAIRFIRDEDNEKWKRHPTLRHLNISNFVSNKAGTDGQKAFTKLLGYEEHAIADPDTFKIEVVDPSGKGGSVKIELEALKPGPTTGEIATSLTGGLVDLTKKAGLSERIYVSIGNPKANMRKIKVECDRVKADNKVRFRSRYMRLVTDEWDFKELSGDPPKTDGKAQALLTTDTADGNDGDADKLEILDQHVRATHTMVCCKAADPDKCKIEAELPIGPRRRRVRVAFHLFRETPGAATMVASVGAKEARHRTRHWFRRLYAQAELSPQIVPSPGIEILDPPPANMITIAPWDGSKSRGKNSGGAVSKITLRSRADGTNTDWTVNLKAGLSPTQVGNLIKKHMPAGHKAVVSRNAVCIGKVRGSADVVITRDDGKRNTILIASTDDTKLAGKLEIANPNVKRLGNPPPNWHNFPEGESGVRRLLRACKTAKNRVDFVVVERFDNMDTGAYAMSHYDDWPSKYRPRSPVSIAVVVGAKSNGAKMDISDKFYSVLAHESGHAIGDIWHPATGDPHLKTDWMYNFEGAADAPDVDKRKRIEDTPLTVKFDQPKKTAPYEQLKHINPVQRLRGYGSKCIARW